MNNCYLDAEAVITFFRMTGRKHIFITGSRGSGKSHLVNNMLKHNVRFFQSVTES